MSKYVRVRFIVDDQKPVIYPPKYPYWCSGYNSDNKPYIIMFCESENYLEYIQKYYPEVKEEHISFCNEYETITFTTRFQKPKWYNSEISKL